MMTTTEASRTPDPQQLTERQQQVLLALDDAYRDASDIARRAGIRTVSPRETAAKFCIQLTKLGLAEKGGSRQYPLWKLSSTAT